MMQQDVPCYQQPHRFTTRAAEVAKEKPGKELTIDSLSRLTVKDQPRIDQCAIQSDLQLHYCLTRRSLAHDLVGACTFSRMEAWHRFLMNQLEHPAPPNFSKPTIEQILRADRAGWVRMAEKLATLKRNPQGEFPMDKALDELQTDPSVLFFLLPLPTGRSLPASAPAVDGNARSSKRRKKKQQAATDNAGGGKGVGKGAQSKGSSGNPSRMPEELKGLKSANERGERICWNYNLEHSKCSFAGPGKQCKRGWHICMKCLKAHPQYQCQ